MLLRSPRRFFGIGFAYEQGKARRERNCSASDKGHGSPQSGRGRTAGPYQGWQTMLVLSRKIGESIVIGKDVVVTVRETHGGSHPPCH
jgi:hypothetical protein